MLIKDCNIIYSNKIETGSILIHNGKINKINPTNHNETKIISGKNLYLSPGFIDVHIHGAGGYDTMDATEYAINAIARKIISHGTTSFLPTTMTMPITNINKAIKTIKMIKDNGSEGAHVLGAHLEGPFINSSAIGAQNPKYILEASIENYNKLVDGCEDTIISITLSPEIPGAIELIKYISSKGIMCCLGHSHATYKEAIDAINSGASHSTHLFNAMSSFNHREPGLVGATFDSNITTEIICDGIHVSYPALRIAYKIKGSDNILLVSDAMMACCMKQGEYSLGGQKVFVDCDSARLKSGALAGSILTLDKAVSNIYKNTTIPLYDIIKMVTFNPAKHCGVHNTKGLIKEGYDADLILFDENINIKRVFILGREIYNK